LIFLRGLFTPIIMIRALNSFHPPRASGRFFRRWRRCQHWHQATMHIFRALGTTPRSGTSSQHSRRRFTRRNVRVFGVGLNGCFLQRPQTALLRVLKPMPHPTPSPMPPKRLGGLFKAFCAMSCSLIVSSAAFPCCLGDR
jgi:hypothetical protein